MRKTVIAASIALAAVAGIASGDATTTPTYRISGILPPASDANGPSALHTGGARNITSDGKLVVFHSLASNLVPGPSGPADVYLWSRATGQVVRVSAPPGGGAGDGPSLWPSVADTGRVAFESTASNLVPGDANNARDVFVRDGPTGALTRVSVSSSGSDSNEPPWSSASSGSSISSDGRYVVFTSRATNLVPGDTNNKQDVFLRDTCAGASGGCMPSTALVSTGAGGAAANNDSSSPTVAAGGRFVAFQSYASNLTACDAQPVNCDTNGQPDIFVRDVLTQITIRVSWPTSPGGPQPMLASASPQISTNGRYVAFESLAQFLSPEDQDAKSDVFVRDLATNSTIRVSNMPPSSQFTENPAEPDEAHFPSVSGDGRFVVYSAGQPLASNVHQHLYVWDRNRGVSVRIPAEPVLGYKSAYGVSPAIPLPPFATGAYPSIAGNGSAVVFVSDDPRIDPADFNNFQDVFIRTFACADCAG